MTLVCLGVKRSETHIETVATSNQTLHLLTLKFDYSTATPPLDSNHECQLTIQAIKPGVITNIRDAAHRYDVPQTALTC